VSGAAAIGLSALLLYSVPAAAGGGPGNRPAAEGQRDPPPALEPRGVPHLASVPAQLAYARRAKAAMTGTEGRERMRRRWDAARAFVAVRSYFPGEPCAGAEATFRAAELLRGGGDLEQALRELGLARDLCTAGPFHARGVLEIGHLQRRLGRAREALDAYEELYAGDGVPRAVRDEATLWAGRVHQQAGRTEEARRLWERAAREAEDPVQRVRAYDELALVLIERGDLEGAAGMLERSRRALHEVAQERTPLGERVRGALGRMRAIAALRHSVERRRGTVRIDRGADRDGGREKKISTGEKF